MFIFVTTITDAAVNNLSSSLLRITVNSLNTKLKTITNELQFTTTVVGALVKYANLTTDKLSFDYAIALGEGFTHNDKLLSLSFATVGGSYINIDYIDQTATLSMSSAVSNYSLFQFPPSHTSSEWKDTSNIKDLGKYYNALRQPWFLTCNDSVHKQCWSKTFIHQNGHKSIGTSKPLYRDNGTLRLVISLSMQTSQIDQVLEDSVSTISSNAIMYIVNIKDGCIVSTSNQAQSNDRYSVCELANRYSNNIVQTIAKKIENEDYSLSAKLIKLQINQKNYFVITQQLIDNYGLEWGLVLGVPVDDLSGPIYALRVRFILVLVGDIIMSGILCLAISCYATHKLNAIGARMNDVTNDTDPAHLRYIASNLAISMLSEISPLQEKFSEMLIRLADSTDSLVEARKQAEEATKRVSVFMSRASHEMRTPLNGIAPPLEMVLSDPASILRDEDRSLLSTSLYCTRMITHLVDDVLDFSKLTGGKLELDKKVFDFQNCVNQITTLIKGLAQQYDVSLNIEVGSGIQREVVGDELRISQILVNLLSNAVKFSGEQHGYVSCRYELQGYNDNEQTIRVIIQDNGQGISEQDMARLFVPFVQLRTHNSDRGGGTGLGLCISKELAQAMGGGIELSSILGGGTTAYFWFPLRICDKGNELITPVSNPILQKNRSSRWLMQSVPSSNISLIPSSSSTLSNRINILVVDDQILNCKVLESMLRRYFRCEVMLASSGMAALRACSGNQFNCILMDAYARHKWC
eukprot:NODE_230_length_3187_cov_41.683747_g200_i0.p1 GENE.NODE_230_length_3187_cov_41.683747_g200_i0~~NODE_230_length_3187_cov_41.683747_g200_i0.p1  ORF type:complete len:804 (-),score=143.94 NODE_230_length_3187_cov_41.683747_g200_i0:775-3027(-)